MELTLLGQNVNAYHGLDARGRDGRARRTLPAPRGDRWARAHPLHHLPSARHGRRSARRPSRGRQAHALPAPAGAVGLGPRPRGDEPPPHTGRVSRDHRAHPRGAPRHRALGRFHRRVPGRDRRRVRGDAVDRRARSATHRPTRSSTRPRPGTPGALLEDQVARGGEGRASRPSQRRNPRPAESRSQSPARAGSYPS